MSLRTDLDRRWIQTADELARATTKRFRLGDNALDFLNPELSTPSDATLPDYQGVALTFFGIAVGLCMVIVAGLVVAGL